MKPPSPTQRIRSALPLSELFLWGQVRRAHGLRGHLLAESFSESPDRYDLSAFWIVQGEVALPKEVVFIAPHTSIKEKEKPLRWWRLRFRGVEDRNAAEKWVRTELYLPRSYLPPLQEGEFYYVEALGAQVVDENGTVRGVLKEIYLHSSYDFFIVENEKGEVFWIPAPFVRKLDRSSNPPILLVEGPEGLWDPSLAKGKPVK
ncbi:MAG: ribosome maturation factor RimM [Bacteroidia bacterium]|nr:ribosome maturation factor RimM [Bacteroidia bacterium]MCX7763302.1 ribosome maturation factor RimM [Bacteroidia bacterium]MDW8058253.1 ribosome maturation factor RimM [Bacteroidia bacterium]